MILIQQNMCTSIRKLVGAQKQGNKIDIIETRACHVIYHKIIGKCVNFINVIKTLQQMYKWY